MSKYPINAVLDGIPTARSGDLAENLIFLGMLTQEVANRGEAVKSLENFRASREYTAWLVSADNYLKYLMDNYTSEITFAMVTDLIRYRKMPFDPRRMTNFDDVSAMFAKAIG